MNTFWQSFVIFGLIFTGLVWVFQSHRVSGKGRIVGTAFVLLLVISATILIGNSVFLGNEAWYEKTPYREAILFALMLLGMLARSLSIAIEERRENIQNKKRKGEDYSKVALELDYWELFYPTLFSVITFGALLSQLSNQSLNVAAIVLAFQTGFFWQTIIKQRKGTSE